MRTPARLLSLALLAAVPASSQTTTRLMDVSAATTFDVETSSPRDFLALGERVVFTAAEPGSGREVWASDGTAAGTELLRDVSPGPFSSGARILGAANGFAWWMGSSTPNNDAFGLWRTDGTRAGTAAILAGGSPLRILPVHAFLNGAIYVSGCGEGAGCGVWRTDGTAAGTRLVSEVEPQEMAAAGGRLFLLAENKLWASDGTAAGTRSLGSFLALGNLVPAGDKVFFLVRGQGDELWASDGTPAGTRRVLQLPSNGGFPVFGFDDIDFLFKAFGKRLYFIADDVLHGEELWVSDGTAQGTRRVTDFDVYRPFDTFMDRRDLEEVDGRLVFLASTGLTPPQVWVTDGRPESTAPLWDNCSGSCGFAGDLARAGGRVYFSANDGSSGFELWSTDGTTAGTRMVRDICTSPSCGGDPHSLRALLGGVVFVARSPDLVGTEVWFSDGTTQGTRPLSDFGPGEGAFAFEPAAAGGKVFFAAFNRYGEELWVYDGRETRLVSDIARRERGSEPVLVGPAGGRMVFRTCENHLVKLRASGGTPETTLPLPFDGGLFCSDSLPAAPVGGLLFFVKASSIASSNPRGLWRTDGTAAGTVQLLELATPGDYLTPPVDVQGQAWFVVYRAAGGSEVWRSDGTPQGTVKAFDAPEAAIELKTSGSRLYLLTSGASGLALWSSGGTLASSHKVFEGHLLDVFAGAGAQLFFLAMAGDTPQLWRTDGTAAGTRLVTSFPNFSNGPQKLTLFQGVLYFFAEDETGDWQLWRSDGTAAGTFPLATAAILRDHVFAEVFEMAAAAGRLFFTAGEEEHGFELWSSDGTVAGTRMLRDIFPGEGSSAPIRLTAAGGKLYFTAHDGVRGAELWSSDGTEAGTRLVQDLSPQALSSHPEQLKATATHLFFTADDGATGREPWALPLAGAGCQPSSTRLCLGGGRFQVEALWRDFQGRSGAGQAVPLSTDTGTFWFFSPENLETVIKVLDGRGVNEHQWVFYGSLSNVEFTLTVTDTETGLARRYFNPMGRFASVGDTRAFGRLGAFSRDGVQVAAPAPPALVSSRTDPAAVAEACVPAPTRLCLNGNRFAVQVAWKDFQGKTGAGTAVPLTADTGYFWFFDAANVELVLKVLDGTPVNGHHWVFYGALSNVEYTITLTDTQTGAVRTYTNSAGQFASVGDTAAF